MLNRTACEVVLPGILRAGNACRIAAQPCDDLSASEVVTRYKNLADIERGFRVLKSDLEIAPVFQRLPERIRAHALINHLRD